jgi:serine/threonine protein kinase
VSGSAQLPRFLGDYAVLRPLAKGLERLRYAVRREPQEHPRLYVIKLFPPVPERTPEIDRERYVPRLTRGLSHRNLVEAYQTGEVGGVHYLVMEYVLSVDLEFALEHCRQEASRIPLEVALFVGREMCRGLAFLHGFGADKLLHGRVAPSHVLLAYSGQLKLAHVHRLLKVGSTTYVASGEVGQVAPYQAPELLEGRPVDQRADVFAVGAILWEILAGRRWVSGRPDTTRELVLSGQLPLGTLNPEAPPEVVEVVERSMSERPEDRFHTAVDLGRRLDALLDRHCPGAGGRLTSDWLVGRFSEEFHARRRTQQQLLAEKRAETSSNLIPEVLLSTAPRTGGIVGQVLDQRYKIQRLVGEGGMGQVYEAEHVQLGKRLAVKILHPLYSTEEEVVERFRREARAASSIGHPNIVNVTDSGTTPDGRAYFVMELLDGMELADVITQEGPMDFERAVDIAIQVCQALGAAHRVGVIHRDMKPENVFLTTVGARTDVVKILDFGIAKNARMERVRGGQLTEPGLAVGTPEYMAPEQAAGKAPDPRFDIYAVGGILYATLTGRPPHRGSNVMEILTRKATKNPTPPRSYRPDLPPELERAMMSALSRNPDRRPTSMEELEYELRKSLAGRPMAVAHMLGISHAIDAGRPEDVHASDSDPAAGRSARAGSGEQPAAGSRPGSGPQRAAETKPSFGDRRSGGAWPRRGEQRDADPRQGRAERLTVEEPEIHLGPPGAQGAEPASGRRPAPEPGDWGMRDLPEDQALPALPSLPGPSVRPSPAGGQAALGDEELFSKKVTPTDIVQWDPPPETPGRTVDEQATTSVYVDTSNLREEAVLESRARRSAGLIGLGLLGGLALISLSAWLLWPPPAPAPRFLQAPPPAPEADPDRPPPPSAAPKALPSLVGWKTPIEPERPSPEAEARYKARALGRYVDFTWRAAGDQRFLEPQDDSVKYGLERIAALDPAHPELGKLRAHAAARLLALAAAQRRRQKIEDAEKSLRGLLGLAPESARGKAALASLLVHRGQKALKDKQPAEAETLQKEAQSLAPENADVMLLGAEILEAKGEPEEARAAFEAVLKAHKRNQAARNALRRIDKERRRPKARPR